MIGFALLRCEETCRFGVTLDRPLRTFMPTDVERPVSREEIERRIGQMFMHPAGQDPPISWFLMFRPETGYDDARHRTHAAIGVKTIPDVPGVIALI